MNTFQCPNCKQFINDSMTRCKFCNMELDPGLISASVELQEKVNKAYNSASKIRILAGGLITLFLLSFLPFVGFIARLVFNGFLIAVPIFMIVWTMKYSGLKTHDADLKTARKYLWIALAIWILSFFLSGLSISYTRI